MRLSEQIINNLEFKNKKNSYLISAVEKLKYHDLLNILNVIDNKKFLNEYSSGWNASHYSVLNNSVEVLFYISNLYIKNNCDLNQSVQRAKNSTSVGDNTLEIAITNQKLEQYILLKSFKLEKHKDYSYFLQKNQKRYEGGDFNSLNLPYEFSLINLFLLSFQYVGIKLLYKDFNYEEKQQITKEFLENHKYLSKNYVDKPIFIIYSGFFDKIIENHHNLNLNCFDFFAIPFIESFKIKQQKMDYSFLNNFNKLYLNNISDFFEQLSNSEYKIEMIKTLHSMSLLLKNDNHNDLKNIKSFFNTYQIEKFLFSIELSDKLVNKNINTKIHKI